MTDLTNYAKGRILDHFMRREPTAAPVQWYVALFLTETGDDESGTEVFEAGYVRQPVIFGPLEGSVECHSVGEILFPPAGENWGIITYFALYDAETGGHMWFHGPLDNDVIVEQGTQLQFRAEAVVVSFQ